MQKIGDLITPPKPPKKPSSERAELIGFFTDTLNRERKGSKYPQLTYKRIGIKLAHLSMQDLYYLKSVLKDCQNRGYPFGKAFFGALKVRPEEGVSSK